MIKRTALLTDPQNPNLGNLGTENKELPEI